MPCPFSDSLCSRSCIKHLDFIGAQSTIRMHNVGIGGSGEKWGNDSDSSSGGSGRGSMRGRAALSSIDWGDSSDRDVRIAMHLHVHPPSSVAINGFFFPNTKRVPDRMCLTGVRGENPPYQSG